ncbi:MAG TPA: hypothetical protein VKS20_02305 [Candidatus Acidoferrales bacterium]|nr:hypothetical protein [Candidatus Acidoferrales bacterium]
MPQGFPGTFQLLAELLFIQDLADSQRQLRDMLSRDAIESAMSG